MTTKQTARQIVSNISSFCFGFFGHPLPKDSISSLEASTASELKNYRPVYSADNQCNVLNERGVRVYHAPTQEQAQEIADALSTYVG